MNFPKTKVDKNTSRKDSENFITTGRQKAAENTSLDRSMNDSGIRDMVYLDADNSYRRLSPSDSKGPIGTHYVYGQDSPKGTRGDLQEEDLLKVSRRGDDQRRGSTSRSPIKNYNDPQFKKEAYTTAENKSRRYEDLYESHVQIGNVTYDKSRGKKSLQVRPDDRKQVMKRMRKLTQMILARGKLDDEVQRERRLQNVVSSNKLIKTTMALLKGDGVAKRSGKTIEAAPMNKEQAAKFIQGWFKDTLNKSNALSQKIVKIQAAYRGHWLRTYVYDMLYFYMLIQAFIDKIKAPIVKDVRKDFLFRLTRVASLNKSKGSRFIPGPHPTQDKDVRQFTKDLTKALRVKVFHKILHHVIRGNAKAEIASPEKGAQGIFNAIIRKRIESMNKKLKGTFSNDMKEKLLKKVFRGTQRHADLWLRFFIHKWRSQLAKLRIGDFGKQVLKHLFRLTGNAQKRSMIRFFNRWKVSKGALPEKKQNLSSEKFLNFFNGFDNFRTFLRKRVYKEIMPVNYLEGIKHRLLEKLGVTGGKFEMLAKRRVINKWKKVIKKPDEFYPKLTKGLNTLKKGIIKKHESLFNDIKNAKNYKRLFEAMLPIGNRLKARLERDRKAKAFNQFKLELHEGRLVHYKGMIFNKLGHLFKNKYKNLRYKCFLQWKRVAGMKPDNSWSAKGWEQLTLYIKRKWNPTFQSAIVICTQDKDKNNGMNKLCHVSKAFSKQRLRYFFRYWQRVIIKMDPWKRTKTLRSLKRIFLQNYVWAPMKKYYHKWNMYMMKYKAVDPEACNNGWNSLAKFAHKKHINDMLSSIHESYQENQKKNFLKKLIPNREKYFKSFMKQYMNRWLKNAKDQGLFGLNCKILNVLFEKGRTALFKRFLAKYFHRWAHREIPLDLARIVNAEGTLFKFSCNKYMKDFFVDMKNYGKFRFLRSCFTKTSKYHMRALRPFIKRWLKTSVEIRDAEARADLQSKLLAKFCKTRCRNQLGDIMRSRFNIWRNNIFRLRKVGESLPQLENLIKRDTLKKSLAPVLFAQKLQNLRSKKLRNINNFAKATLLRKLYLSFMRWRNNLGLFRITDMQTLLKQRVLNNLFRKSNKMMVLKAFLIWKTITKKVDKQAYINGWESMKRYINGCTYKQLTGTLVGIQTTVPFGVSLLNCLIRKKFLLAKSVIMRNFATRPYYKRWYRFLKAERELETKQLLFSKIFGTNLKRCDKLMKRKVLEKWRKLSDLYNNRATQEAFHLKILKNIYAKNIKILFIRTFRRWKETLHSFRDEEKRKLDAADKMKKAILKKALADVADRLLENKDCDRKKDVLKKAARKLLNHSKKGMLLYAMSLWKKYLTRMKELRLKLKILKNLVNKHEKDSVQGAKNKMHECLLQWRIKAPVKDFYSVNEKYAKGWDLLHKFCVRPFNEPIRAAFLQKFINSRFAKLLFRFIRTYDVKATNFYLNYGLKTWKRNCGDTRAIRDKFLAMCDKYIKSKRNAIYKQPVVSLVDCMQAYIEMKKGKAFTIQSFCKGLFSIFARMQLMKRNKHIFMLFGKFNVKTMGKLRAGFLTWLRNSKIGAVADSCQVVQKFIKQKKHGINKRREALNKAADHLKNYMYIKLLKKLMDISLNFRKRRMLLRIMKDIPPELSFEFRKRYFFKWRNFHLYMKQNAAAFFITNLMRGYIARVFKNKMLKRKRKITDLVIKLFGKHLDMSKLLFIKWRLDNKANRWIGDAKIIQDFVKNGLVRAKKAAAKKAVGDVMHKYWRRLISKSLGVASKVQPDRADIMYNTLSKVYPEKYWKILKESLLFKGRLRKLNRTITRIKKSLRHYWIPYYMRIWKKNTWDHMMAMVTRLQMFVRAKLVYWRYKALYRRQCVMRKFMIKMTRDMDLKKHLCFKEWAKQVKIGLLDHQVRKLQNAWQSKKTRKDVLKVLAQTKLKAMVAKKLFKHVPKTMKELFEQKNKHRMMALMVKRNTILTNYKKFFKRWKNWCKAMALATLMIQKKVRKWKSIKKVSTMKKIRNCLMSRFMKLEENDDDKKRVVFDIWLRNVGISRMDSSAKIITKFVKDAHKKWKASKKDKVENTTTNLVNTVMKVFLEQLKKKLAYAIRYKKVQWIFIKRFSHMDKSLRSMYLEHYMVNWRDRAIRLRNKANGASFLMIACIRGFLTRKFVKLMLLRKNKMNALLFRLFGKHNDMTQLYFRLWKTIIKRTKLLQDAHTIQKFVKGVVPTMNKMKKARAHAKLGDAFDPLKEQIKKAVLKKPFNEVKQFSRKNGLKKFFDFLANKRYDNFKKPLDDIKALADHKKAKKLSACRNIQKAYRLHKDRQGIWGLITRIKKLRLLLRMMGDKELRLQCVFFKHWKKNCFLNKLFYHARIISNFVNDNVLNSRKDKKAQAMGGLADLFKRSLIHSYKSGMKMMGLLNKFDYVGLLIKKHIFKFFIRKVMEAEKLMCLAKMFKIPKSLGVRYLKYWNDKWRNINAVEKAEEQRLASLNEKLQLIFARLAGKHENMNSFFLRLWKRQANKEKILQSAAIIQKFIKDKRDLLIQRRRWMRLTYGLYLLNGKLSGFEVLRRLRIKRGLSVTKRFVKHTLIEKGWDDFKKKLRTYKIMKLLETMFKNFDRRQDIVTQAWGLNNLRKKVGRIKQKELGRVDELAYLLKITFMHKEVARKHYIRELLRKWRFVVFMKKVAKQKMEAMYKTMHLNYLTMANEVFGDDEHGLIKEFESFGNKMGMFTNEDLDNYDEIKKKFYKNVKKRYEFDPLGGSQEYALTDSTDLAKSVDTQASKMKEQQ
jgi:hypothetical protein